MKKFKKITALILSLAMVLALVACGNNSNSSNPPASNPGTSNPPASSSGDSTPADTTLTVGILNGNSAASDGFDPISSTNSVGCNLVYETLFDIDPNTSEAVNILAESWSYDDETHLRVKLHDNATFSNGDPVTAQDVYWSWYRNISENSRDAGNLDFIDWENWEFVSDKEFVISFNKAFGPAINYMTMRCFSVMSKAAMENATSDDYWSAPVGSGPYTVKENVSGSYSSYVLNENYWNTDLMPEATEITIRHYSEASTMYVDFETGALDLAWELEANDADRAVNLENAKLETVSLNNTIGICFPEYTEALSDVRVRQALAYAMDVQALTEMGYGSLATVSSTIIPSGVQNVAQTGIQEYNPEKARQLLADAGVSDLTLSLVIVGSPTNERIATALAAYFLDVGVTLKVESCDLATAISHFMNNETDIGINSGSVVSMDTYEALMMTLETSTNGTIRITDAAYNQALLSGSSTSDDAERAQAYVNAQNWLHDNYRQVAICEPTLAYVYRTDKIAAVNSMVDEAMTLRYVEFVG